MAKKQKSRGPRSFTIPVAPVFGLVSAPCVRYAIDAAVKGNLPEAIGQLGGLAGVNRATGQFDVNTLVQNLGPLFTGMIVHKIASKIGINRTLAAAGVPILRV